jgi:hypothetical protein
LRLLIGEKPGNIFSDCSERCVTASTALTGSLVAVSPTLVVVTQATPPQMNLLGEVVQIKGGKRKKR